MYNRMQESGVGDEGNVNTQPVVSPVHQQTVYLRPSGLCKICSVFGF